MGYTYNAAEITAETVAVNNCYTVEGTTLVGTDTYNMVKETGCGVVTEKVLSGYAAQLGSAFTQDYQVQNNLYPVLTWQNAGCPTSLTTDAEGTYLINTAEELRLLSYIVNTYSDPNADGFKFKKVETSPS